MILTNVFSGSRRLIFYEKTLLQEADYYPFGMRHDRSVTATNHYLYNGKELNTDLGLDWYDYGFRWYDAEIGRFPSVDPIIENFPDLTPYNYASNNPSTLIDLWGLQGAVPYHYDPGTDGLLIAKIGYTILTNIGDAMYNTSISVNDVLFRSTNAEANRIRYILANNHNISFNESSFISDEYLIGQFEVKYSWNGNKGYYLDSKDGLLVEALEGLGNAVSIGSTFIGGNNPAALFAKTPMGPKQIVNLVEDAAKKTKFLPSGGDVVKHHIFNVFRGGSPKSQKYRDFFKKHNIDLDANTVHIPKKLHDKLHEAGNNWTTKWKRWIDANPNVTTKEVYQKAGRMMEEYGIQNYPILPYK